MRRWVLWALGGGWVALIVIIWGVWWLVSQGHQMGWGCPIGVIWDVVIDAPLAYVGCGVIWCGVRGTTSGWE